MSQGLDIGLRSPHDILEETAFCSGPGWSVCSIRGPGRSHNSDAYSFDLTSACLAFAIADGVGALEGSPYASMAAAAAATGWVQGRSSVRPSDVPQLVEVANAAVKDTLSRNRIKGATTIACAVIAPTTVVIATVGDSEALAVTTSGPATRLNELDHVPARPNVLLAWLDGESPVEPHAIEIQRLPHRLCLVTDGVSRALDYTIIAEVVRSSNPAEAARDLVQHARKNGATDDATAIVISGVPSDWKN